MLTPVRHEITLAAVTLLPSFISLSKPPESVTAEAPRPALPLEESDEESQRVCSGESDRHREEQLWATTQLEGFRTSLQGIQKLLAKPWLTVADAIGQPSTSASKLHPTPRRKFKCIGSTRGRIKTGAIRSPQFCYLHRTSCAAAQVNTQRAREEEATLKFLHGKGVPAFLFMTKILNEIHKSLL